MKFKAKLNFSEFGYSGSGSGRNVSIFVWSRNNPDKKYKFVEVAGLSERNDPEVEVEIPLFEDE